MAKITLGYWDIRGLAEPIRWLLHYKKVKFEDKRYHFENDQLKSDEWQKDKFALGLDFPNLPYYIEGDLKLTQSSTILRYLAEKYGMGGRTEEEKLKVHLLEQQMVDMRWHLAMTCFKENYEELKPEFAKKASGLLLLLSKFLGSKKFLIGDEVTYADFIAYDILDFYRMFIPTIMDDFENLRTYQERVKNLPELQDYIRSSTYKRWPIFGPILHWGYKGEEPKYD